MFQIKDIYVKRYLILYIKYNKYNLKILKIIGLI